ncbi:STAS domain-containing protein [candidate division KSB1 bacterium]
MSEDNFKYSLYEKGSLHVILVEESRLNGTNAPLFKTELLRIITGGAKNLVINVKNVESIDSSGLGAITFGNRQMEESGGKISLCCLSDKVSTLFKIAKLDRVFDIFDSEEDAQSK